MTLRLMNLAWTTMLLIALGVTAGCSTTTQSSRDVSADPVFRHIVMFKFNDTATEQQIADIVAGFNALPGQIEQITAYEHGLNTNTDDNANGFTHIFLVTFANEEGLAVYGPHPAHQAFVAELLPVLDEVLVADYWAGG
ncbi:Dabb family protein [Phycisphaeraceae bacterium D3-23]